MALSNIHLLQAEVVYHVLNDLAKANLQSERFEHILVEGRFVSQMLQYPLSISFH